jgi:hypothetical protein
MSDYKIAPITGRQALVWVEQNHRHLPKLQGALFAVSVEWFGMRVGVATVGNPPRKWQGKGKAVISRCAVMPDLPSVTGRDGREHAAPACTMLYRSCADACRSLGYSEVWTYTLQHEDGRSLKAAGFKFMGWSADSSNWRVSRAGRTPVETGPKGRWMRTL